LSQNPKTPNKYLLNYFKNCGLKSLTNDGLNVVMVFI